MTKDNAAQYLPLVQALADGKTIQFNSASVWTDWDWKICPSIVFDAEVDLYRIKPQPKLRPWKADEMPKVGTALKGFEGEWLIVARRTGQVWIRSGWALAEHLLADWTQLDGSPCGVMEE